MSTNTEDAVRRFLADEAGAAHASDELLHELRGRAARRRAARRRTGLALAAAALIAVVGVAAMVLAGDRSTKVEFTPPGPEQSIPETTVTTPSTTPSTIPAAIRPATAIAATKDQPRRVVVIDTASKREVRTLYTLPAGDGYIVSSLTLSDAGANVVIQVHGPGPENNCAPKQYSVPVAGGAVTERKDLGYLPSFSPDGSRVAFTVDSSRYGGPSGPGFHCRQALMVRDLRTGAETVWSERTDEEGSQASIDEVTWSADGTRLLFTRRYQRPLPDEGFVAEIRSLDIAKRGDVKSASELLHSGTGPVLDGGAGQGQFHPSDPVWLPGGAFLYMRHDGNTDLAAVMRRAPGGAETEVLAQRTVDLLSIDGDADARFFIAVYEDEARMFDANGKTERLGGSYWSVVW